MVRSHNEAVPTVVVLGDDQTVYHCEQDTACHGPRWANIAAMYAFPSGDPASRDDLTDVEAVVAALARAISAGLPIWMPNSLRDLGREEHYRRLCMVLHRHGLDLLVDYKLWLAPGVDGMNEIDHALRREVQAVDALDRAALAAAGVESIETVVEKAAVALQPMSHQNGWPPTLPQPDFEWVNRHDLVMSYVRWLVDGCGVTRAAAARVLNSSGQRTPDGKAWQSRDVSALLNGICDRGAAA
ncbi:hypothetical protein BST36_25720 [Mycolicibacterium moriokaense]|nr:hypothetical protein [Mycolicibacterium moriokaense]ORB16731.1 hypothetical protein BST36_25720 [Mycolicibacterium moriokaense]